MLPSLLCRPFELHETLDPKFSFQNLGGQGEDGTYWGHYIPFNLPGTLSKELELPMSPTVPWTHR